MNNHFVESEKTSVRVRQTPGGNSNLNLGWQQKCEAVKNRKIDRNQSNIVFSDGSQEPLMEKRNNFQVVTEVPVKVQQQIGGNTTIALGEEHTNAPKTSVKVRAPPGGKSNIIFG